MDLFLTSNSFLSLLKMMIFLSHSLLRSTLDETKFSPKWRVISLHIKLTLIFKGVSDELHVGRSNQNHWNTNLWIKIEVLWGGMTIYLLKLKVLPSKKYVLQNIDLTNEILRILAGLRATKVSCFKFWYFEKLWHCGRKATFYQWNPRAPYMRNYIFSFLKLWQRTLWQPPKLQGCKIHHLKDLYIFFLNILS